MTKEDHMASHAAESGGAKPQRIAELQAALARVEAATADAQWALIRDAARVLLDIDDLARSRINQLCDAGGFTDAALALVDRVLPGWLWEITTFTTQIGDKRQPQAFVISPDHPPGREVTTWGTAPTPPLALLEALLKALIAQEEAHA